MDAPHLRFYLDTADVNTWTSWLPTGLFYGVTCNPLLLERANVNCTIESLTNLAQRAFELGVQEVHLQAWGETAAAIGQVGQALSRIDSRIVVKVPATIPGVTAATELIKSGIPVTLTAVYAVHQALIAAAIGASYAAPYLGRMNDAGCDGVKEIATMQQALNGTKSQMRLLTASIRDVRDISALAARGVDTFTFSEAIAQAFFNVPETLAATADFERATKAMH